jgi:membrane-bound serine protease (ClpP class)
MKPLVVAGLALALATPLGAGQEAADPPGPAGPGNPALARIVIDGTINPAVADFVRESIDRARDAGAPALVVQLDTPGGLLPSTRAIVKDILAAPVPGVVWVAPSGAGAGSAGVFITLAAHVAAMAPGTNIGAAHPVGGQGEDIKGVLGEKIESFTASFSEAIARTRGRNVDWAVKAVRKSVSITAEEAAKIKVVDFVAKDIDELLAKATGRWVDVAGEWRQLAFDRVRGRDGHARVETFEMGLGQRILNVIADPNIAYLLMMAGMLGLYIEFTHPGVVFPGVAGAICLLLALTALHVLPLNTSGLALLLLGVGLLVAEAFLPTFGLVGVGGLVAFLIGSLFLFHEGTGVAVARSVVFGVGGGVATIMLVIASLVVRSHRAQPRLGVQGMIGEVGVARHRLAPAGTVVVRGEYWAAESEEPVDVGERVEVTGVEGLRLRVRRARREAS